MAEWDVQSETPINPVPPPAPGEVDPWAIKSVSPFAVMSPTQTQQDSPWSVKKETPFDELTKEPVADKPMPGIIESGWQGLKSAASGAKQSAETIAGGNPEVIKEESPAAQPYEWRDLFEPTRGLAKTAHGFAHSAPTIAAGVLGATAGTAVAPGTGTLVGGVSGAALGAAFQAVGPEFARELQKTPKDPDGAWERALGSTAIAAAGSGASWALYPLKIAGVSQVLKNMAFQAFGVQPGVSMAQKVASNIHEGESPTKDIGQAYAQGAVGTLVPAVGHHIVAGGLRAKAPLPETPRTPQQEARLTAAETKKSQADSLENQAKNPNTSADQFESLTKRSEKLREQARNDEFFANVGTEFKPLKGMAKSWIENFQPELVSDPALKAEPLFGQMKSVAAHWKDSLTHQTEKHYYQWNKVPFEDTLKFLSKFEHGQALPADLVTKYPWMRERASSYRKWLDEAYRDEAKFGSQSEFYENYFPHIWEKPSEARSFFLGNMNKSMGSRWFQKGRYYEDIQLGLDSGLKLKSKNPEELVARRLLSGAEMKAKMGLLEQLQSYGLAVPVEKAPEWITQPRRDITGKWEQVNAPNGKAWALAPDIQPLWNNSIQSLKDSMFSRGLWADEGAVGSGFRQYMKLKNVWVPIKLGASLFHPVHVAGISLGNNLSRAYWETFGRGQQSLSDRLLAFPRAAGDTARDIGSLPTILVDNLFRNKLNLQFHEGRKIQRAWETMPGKQTAEQKADVKILNEAGISAQLSEQLRISAKRDLHDAISNGDYTKALVPLVRRTLERASGWIFEEWIPQLKVAGLKREAEAMLRRDPSLINDAPRRLVAMRALGKQIDNRYGEMFYGSLNWNRTTKDAAIGAFLSLGWNLGFAREFVGGALEPSVRRLMGAPTPTRQLIRNTTSKGTNLLAYAFTSMLANAIMTKIMSGNDPVWMDFIFPRIGGLNPDGTERRQSNPYYTREIPMAWKNIQDQGGNVPLGLAQMIYHKMMIAPFVEIGTNKDYFGSPIRNLEDPAYKQIIQFGHHIVNEQLSPMSMTGAKRSLQLSGKPYSFGEVIAKAYEQKSLMPIASAMTGILDPDVYMPILGFGPAPAYASRTETQNAVSRAYSASLPSNKSYELKESSQLRREARDKLNLAILKNDPAARNAAAIELAKLGVKSDQIRKIQPGNQFYTMFQRLQTPEQVSLLRNMSKEEFKKYYTLGKPNTKTKNDPRIRPLVKEYFSTR